jgi:hypothetical protein
MGLSCVKLMLNFASLLLITFADSLSLNILSQIGIPPKTKNFSLSAPILVAISPKTKILSRCDQLPSEMFPGLIHEDEMIISTYIDGLKLETIFICKICHCDLFRSTQVIKNHLCDVHNISIQPRADYPFEPTFECLS